VPIFYSWTSVLSHNMMTDIVIMMIRWWIIFISSVRICVYFLQQVSNWRPELMEIEDQAKQVCNFCTHPFYVHWCNGLFLWNTVCVDYCCSQLRWQYCFLHWRWVYFVFFREPLHLAWWNFARTCTLTTSRSLLNTKVIHTSKVKVTWVFCAFFVCITPT